MGWWERFMDWCNRCDSTRVTGSLTTLWEWLAPDRYVCNFPNATNEDDE